MLTLTIDSQHRSHRPFLGRRRASCSYLPGRRSTPVNVSTSILQPFLSRPKQNTFFVQVFQLSSLKTRNWPNQLEFMLIHHWSSFASMARNQSSMLEISRTRMLCWNGSWYRKIPQMKLLRNR